MPIFQHVLILLSSALVAAALAVSLPRNLAGIDPLAGALIGGGVFLAGAVLHLAVVLQARFRRAAREIAALRDGQVKLLGELDRARGEAMRIHEAILSTAETRQGQSISLDEVMTEVRVLQGLVEQLSANEKAAAAQAQAQAQAAEAQAATAGRAVARSAGSSYDVITGLTEDQVLDIVREGLRCNRVDLFLQPVVSLPQRKRRFYECFSRIRTEKNGMVMPEQYIAIAEREGLIAAIDNMLLFRCVQLLRRTQKQNLNVGFFVNISRHTLADTRFFRDFVAFMTSNQELAPNLIFEFAQADLTGQGEPLMLELERLARLGFRFSMDQVTNLDLDGDELTRRRVRFVKLDIVDLIERMQEEGGFESIAALKRMLDRSGIDMIVEKIESEQALVELLDLAIDFGQGYLFGEPRLSKSA